MSRKERPMLPRYCVVGARPVKAVSLADGSLEVLAWDWAARALVRDMSQLTAVLLPAGRTTLLTEEQFERHLDRLRERNT